MGIVPTSPGGVRTTRHDAGLSHSNCSAGGGFRQRGAPRPDPPSRSCVRSAEARDEEMCWRNQNETTHAGRVKPCRGARGAFAAGTRPRAALGSTLFTRRQFSGHAELRASPGRTACPPDSCLCHPSVETAQQPPGPCLPASHPLPPAAVPAGSEGQLAPGAASQARPLTSAPKSPLVRPWPGTVAPSPRATDAMWTALGLTPACVGAAGASMAPAEPRCPLGPLLFP